jgi:hypothetical protein
MQWFRLWFVRQHTMGAKAMMAAVISIDLGNRPDHVVGQRRNGFLVQHTRAGLLLALNDSGAGSHCGG